MTTVACKKCKTKLQRERNIAHATCPKCVKELAHKNYLRNQEKNIQYQKRRRKEKQKEIITYKKGQYLASREEILKRVKAYYKRNRERTLAQGKKYRSNPDVKNRIREKNRTRRMLLKAFEKETDVSIDYLLKLKNEKKTCALCGIILTDSAGDAQRHLDHIVPLCVRGNHRRSNLRFLCRKCNLSRPKDGRDNTTHVIKNGEDILW